MTLMEVHNLTSFGARSEHPDGRAIHAFFNRDGTACINYFINDNTIDNRRADLPGNTASGAQVVYTLADLDARARALGFGPWEQ